MRAVHQTTVGDPEVLQIIETERPERCCRQVLVEVRAIGVNPVEAVHPRRLVPAARRPPFVLGWDVSGVVVGRS